MNDAARTFPATAGVEGVHDADGGVISSYDINEGNRNNAASACMRTKGWQLVPQTAQSSTLAAPTPSQAPTDPVLTCKGNVFKASQQVAPKQINGGVLRFQVGRKVITVTTAEGAVVPYQVEGTHDGMLVASKRDPDGSLYYVHVSVAERAFVMMHVVGGQPMEALSGPCT